MMSRQEAEAKLKEIFGFDNFFDNQWKTIENIFNGKRVLLIEKTGFGKSLCFQFPATQFDGITIVFSPLIALMRDQVKNLNAKGIKASYINSEQSYEEQQQVIKDALNNQLKILYIAPERQENIDWINIAQKLNLSMVVIDEAHTISVWGHDFRPAFRKIINLVNLLPKNFPILATTATATKRVQKDIEKQIAGELITIRGNLLRKNFRLFVIEVESEEEKFIWLGENLKNIPGTGILYTGTRNNTEIYSKWLNHLNIESVEYNARLDADFRKEIESGLMNNKWKCVVSTNALGMGIDKPDIRFIIHTQIPASPIHYYQEIGRAGRDGEPTYIILFYNSKKDYNGIPEDYKIPKYFIDTGRPNLKLYSKVIKYLKSEPMSKRQLIKSGNLKSNQVRVIIADLIDQGIISEIIMGRNKYYEYKQNAPDLNSDYFEELRDIKVKELDSMIDYVYTSKPRMKFLCEYLGDKLESEYKYCDNTSYSKRKVVISPLMESKLKEFLENEFPILDVVPHRSNDILYASNNMINGVAASYYGVSNVGDTLHRCKYENGGDFPDFLLNLTVKAFKKKFKNEHFDLLLYVPPTESGDLVKNFAIKLSNRINIPISHKLIKIKKNKPQKIFQNNYLKQDNVTGVFDYTSPSEIDNKSVLLFDDIYDSGKTIKEIGKILTNFGAKVIAPIVIAKTVGGTI